MESNENGVHQQFVQPGYTLAGLPLMPPPLQMPNNGQVLPPHAYSKIFYIFLERVSRKQLLRFHKTLMSTYFRKFRCTEKKPYRDKKTIIFENSIIYEKF